MKLLKAEDNSGFFLGEDNKYQEIDKISKEDLLRIMEQVLSGNGTLEEYDAERIKNQAHQVVYKSIYLNLSLLAERRQEFIDEAERLYLEDYKRYAEDGSQQ